MLGDDPQECKGTSVEFEISEEDNEGEWGAKIISTGQTNPRNSLLVEVYTPSNCIVGKWELQVYLKRAFN